jgi:hypothetical protein
MIERWVTKKHATHLNMSGGPSLRVPNEETELFMSTYINQVQSGQKLYLVELKSPLFRFFMDIDYVADAALTESEIISLVHEMNACIPGRCLCAISVPTRKGTKIKTGLHLHWPECIVSRKRACELIQNVPDHLKESVDESVYKGSGLRLLWSFKRGNGPIYVPFYDTVSKKIMDQTPCIETLKLFSIRTPFHITENSSGSESEKDTHGLETFIRRYMEGQSSSHVLKIDQKGIVRTDSRYCERIHREHKSNHVYFVIENNTIHQRCYDDDCKGFKGRKLKLIGVEI